jgi:hypothetical protein
MTEQDSILGGLADESRRSFMKKSAIASGGLAMGLSGAGTVAAQDGGNQNGNVMRGLMFNNQFHPRARFEIISQQIDWAPVETDQEGDDFLSEENDDLLFDNPNVFGNFNTRVVNYQVGRQSWALLFVHESANVQQGQVYELSPTFNPFGTDDFQQFGISDGRDDLFNDGGNELGLVTVQFSPSDGGQQGGGQGTTTPGGDGNETDGNETGGN